MTQHMFRISRENTRIKVQVKCAAQYTLLTLLHETETETALAPTLNFEHQNESSL